MIQEKPFEFITILGNYSRKKKYLTGVTECRLHAFTFKEKTNKK